MAAKQSPMVGEKYVSLAVLAERWEINEALIRVLFKNETEGVLRAPRYIDGKPRVAFVTEGAARRLWQRHSTVVM